MTNADAAVEDDKEEGANDREVGRPGDGPMQTKGLGVQIAVERRVILSGLRGYTRLGNQVSWSG